MRYCLAAAAALVLLVITADRATAQCKVGPRSSVIVQDFGGVQSFQSFQSFSTVQQPIGIVSSQAFVPVQSFSNVRGVGPIRGNVAIRRQLRAANLQQARSLNSSFSTFQAVPIQTFNSFGPRVFFIR